jgi:hypothetical protein
VLIALTVQDTAAATMRSRKPGPAVKPEVIEQNMDR